MPDKPDALSEYVREEILPDLDLEPEPETIRRLAETIRSVFETTCSQIRESLSADYPEVITLDSVLREMKEKQ